MSKKEISITELLLGLKQFQEVTDNSDSEMVGILVECTEVYKRKIYLKEILVKKECP